MFRAAVRPRGLSPLATGQSHRFPGSALNWVVVADDPPHTFRYNCESLVPSLDAAREAAVRHAAALLGISLDGNARTFLHAVDSRARCIQNSRAPLGAPRRPTPRGFPVEGFERPAFDAAEELFCYFARHWVHNQTGCITLYSPGVTRKTHWPIPVECTYPARRARLDRPVQAELPAHTRQSLLLDFCSGNI